MPSHILKLTILILLPALVSCKAFEEFFKNVETNSKQIIQPSSEILTKLKPLTPLGQTFFHLEQAGSQIVDTTGVLFSILETPLERIALMNIVNMDSELVFPVLTAEGKQLTLKPEIKNNQVYLPVFVTNATKSVIKFDYRHQNNRCTPYIAAASAEDDVFIAGSFQDYDCSGKY